MPHTPSPRPHLLRYVASRGIQLLCIERAYGQDVAGNRNRMRTSSGRLLFHNERTLCAPRLANAVSHITRGAKSFAPATVALALAVACTPTVNQIRIEAGPAAFKPVFVLTDTTGHAPSSTIYGLSVIPCGADTAVWQIAASGSNRAPMRIAYGDSLPGYVVHVGPRVLRPGCYDVFVTDGRQARFRLDGIGHISGAAARDTGSR